MDPCHLTVPVREPAGTFGRWEYWLPLLLVIASGCASGPPATARIHRGRPGAAGELDSAAPSSLRVATFNVWGLPSWINGAASDRYGRMAHELAQLESDVVLLQEVWTHRSHAVLAEQAQGAARTWWTASARRAGGFLGQNGLLTLSRYPIEGREFRRFDAARLPDSFMHKGALKVTLLIPPGQRVNLWNVHLQDGASGRIRWRQIAQLVRWIEEADDGQVADIVGGDFNFTPESGEFRHFAAAVGPSVHQLAKQVAPPSWDGLKPAPAAGQALDHIFVKLRPPLDEVCAYPRRILAASRRSDRLSDHMGVEALLTFRSAGEIGPANLVLQAASPARRKTSALISQ
jgi:endonuclease/exonuclease/phosphatase family metal-dependent hydrolase